MRTAPRVIRSARPARVALIAALLTFSLAGCAGAIGPRGSSSATPGGSSSATPGGSGSVGSGSQNITGHWQLVSGTDAHGAITTGDAVVTFTINGASSGGHGPCNSFGATTRGNTTGPVTIVVGIHTDIACIDPELNSGEARYFAALNTVTNAALADGTLTLSGGADTLVFKATR